MQSKLFSKIRNFFSKPKKRKITFGSLREPQELDYKVSWSDEFDIQVLRQLREIPARYRELWEKERELSTKQFRDFLENKKKKQDREFTRVEE